MTNDKLFAYALKLLNRRNYSAEELIKKIKKNKDFSVSPQADFGGLIDRLNKLNLINDYNYAKNIINYQIKYNPGGLIRLRNYLQKHRLQKQIIDSALEEINLDELSLADTFLQKKSFFLDRLPLASKKNKIISLLRNRGFRPSTIAKVLSKKENPDII